MKRIFQHPPKTESEPNGRRYWRSLEELADTPEFREQVEREFPVDASEMNEVDRRHFMKIMAASFALGGLAATGCRRPEAKILAYAKTPEFTIPGLPLYFASAFPRRGGAVPVVVETHQGRPTKIEGNPSYTPNGGATDAITQASVLDLYDPDRARYHRRGENAVPLAQVHEFLAGLGPRFQANQGAGLAFLAEPSTSPTRRRLVQLLRQRLPRAIWAEYDPVDASAPQRVTSRLTGRPSKPHYNFKRAQRIVAIDADFVSAEDDSLRYQRDFIDGRRVRQPGDPMNRLYVVESALTLTGSMADHRLRAPSSQMIAVLAQLAVAAGVAESPALSRLAATSPADANWISTCAEDLRAHRGSSLVLAGPHLPDAAHAIALLINQALGNLGATVTLLEVEAPIAVSIQELATAISGGGVQTLFVLGGNPVYNAPADLDWAALQAGVGEVVRVGYHDDESAQGAAWLITAAHYLESWSDARTPDGTVVPVQPMIEPLFGGFTDIEILARVLGEPAPDPHSQVVATFGGFATGDAAKAFDRFLHEGLLEGSAWRAGRAGFDVDAARALLESAQVPSAPAAQRLEVRFSADPKVDDGRFANNGWLQELPDPITKITWDNAITISPHLANELGITAGNSALQIIRKNPNSFERGREVAPWARVSVEGRSVEGPIHIQPGLDNYTVVLPLGYGRTRTGRVGNNLGFNAYLVRGAGAAIVAGATLELIESRTPHQLASTQEHWSMEGREIVREANLEGEGGFNAQPDFVQHIGMESHTPAVYHGFEGPLQERVTVTPRGQSLYGHPNLDGIHQWGMVIDLGACTGCSACVIACQAENNIPIVGRDQVRRGREMHWIRIDRYYADGRSEAGAFGGAGNAIVPDNPQVVTQPMLCVHCESAPCETVCPVNATVHDGEGLNTMAYNRCIGTRYCANNCPYKVRRFNFFDYNKSKLDELYLGPAGDQGMPDLVKMAKNPDVTVRMRGVMEKCTYCVQRIQEAKIAQKVKARDTGNVKVPDGGVTPACAQVCPTTAIVFGDITDPESRVSKLKALSLDYEVLGYLNTRPRTTYLARIRNPNPAMPDYVPLPFSRQEYDNKNHPHHEGGDHGAPDAHAPAAGEAHGGAH